MNDNNEINIVPPRLNKEMVIAGFHAWEAVTILFSLLAAAILFKSLPLIAIIAIVCVLVCRFDGEHNALYWLGLLFNYYSSPQQYSSEGVKKK